MAQVLNRKGSVVVVFSPCLFSPSLLFTGVAVKCLYMYGSSVHALLHVKNVFTLA